MILGLELALNNSDNRADLNQRDWLGNVRHHCLVLNNSISAISTHLDFTFLAKSTCTFIIMVCSLFSAGQMQLLQSVLK